MVFFQRNAVSSEAVLKGLDAYFAWRRAAEGEAAVRQEASASTDAPQTGIARKKPVFGCACKICPLENSRGRLILE
jgi:hypothetical protein